MTHRIKKKLMKRMGYRRYSNYRFHTLLSKIAEVCSDIGECNIPIVITGRKANEKCIDHIVLLKNAYPVSINNDMDHLNYTAGQHEVVQYQIQFTCTKYESPQINKIAGELLKKHKILDAESRT